MLCIKFIFFLFARLESVLLFLFEIIIKFFDFGFKSFKAKKFDNVSTVLPDFEITINKILSRFFSSNFIYHVFVKIIYKYKILFNLFFKAK